jgi:hypothetical protein
MNKSLTLYSASKIEGGASCHRTGGEKLHGELECVQTTALITATTLMDAGIQDAMRFLRDKGGSRSEFKYRQRVKKRA